MLITVKPASTATTNRFFSTAVLPDFGLVPGRTDAARLQAHAFGSAAAMASDLLPQRSGRSDCRPL
jgi:hypothetical protein